MAYKLFFVIFVLVIAFIYVVWRNDVLKRDLSDTQERYEAALKSLDDLSKSHDLIVQSMSAVNEADKARAENVNQSLRIIENAPETDDGPVAPVLRRALDGLR